MAAGRSRLGVAVMSALLTAVIGITVYNFVGNEKRIQQRLQRLYSLDDPRFERELGVLLGPPVLAGNRYQALRNGDEIFPTMLAAIRAAQKTITFESYIYWSGPIGNTFAAALAERARAGVQVHVLLDWVGSAKVDASVLEQMRAAGVDVRRYHPVRWYTLGKLNNRTHRKLLVVDGKLGFTGGVGIAPEWTGHAQDPAHWRDSHFRVEGPVVGQMQAVFMDNWTKVSGNVPHGDDYFPALPALPALPAVPALLAASQAVDATARSAGRAQMFSSSPTGGSESMELMYLLAITAASRSIDLSAAYFVPDELTSKALVAAMERGVKVRVIVPGEYIDSETSRSASRARWGPVLQAGGLIAEYGPTMYHCKVMIVDGLLVSVGSTNFDNRSFHLNDEATLNILDKAFAAEQTATFESDLQLSRPVSFQAWQQRPWTEKLKDGLASLIGAQL